MKCNNQKSATSLSKLASQSLLLLSIVGSNVAMAGDREDVARMYGRLTGTIPTNTVLDSYLNGSGNMTQTPEQVARDIIDNTPAFYNVTLKNFAAPWTNEAQDIFVPLNDYTATVIGVVRDDLDFRRILWDNIIYTGSSGNPAADSNVHYEQLETNGTDLYTDLVVNQQSTVYGAQTKLTANDTAGVMTSRAGAVAFYSGGTNRAMFRFTLMNHLCTDLEPIKDISRVPDRVRRDVSRSPGGDSRIFMNACVGCHAGMDGMSGAFAKYELDKNGTADDPSDDYLRYDDFASNDAETDTDKNGFDANGIALKYNINPNNFKHGYVTTDDSWINYWRNGTNKLIVWSNPTAVIDPENFYSTGNGAKSLGQELANTRAFATCQVKKVFKNICLRDPDVFAADRAQVESIATSHFGADGSGGDGNMKGVFAKVAAFCRTPQ